MDADCQYGCTAGDALRARGGQPRVGIPAAPRRAVRPHRMQDDTLDSINGVAMKTQQRAGIIHWRE